MMTNLRQYVQLIMWSPTVRFKPALFILRVMEHMLILVTHAFALHLMEMAALVWLHVLCVRAMKMLQIHVTVRVLIYRNLYTCTHKAQLQSCPARLVTSRYFVMPGVLT